MMVRFFSSIIASLSGSARPRKTTPAPRRGRLGLESLEGRALPSVSPIAVAVPLTGQISTVQPTYEAPAQVPALQGYTFHMSDGTSPFILAIQTETHLADGSATFTGTYKSPYTLLHPREVLSGTLKYEGGELTISFKYSSDGSDTLVSNENFHGTITPDPTHFGAIPLNGVRYRIHGHESVISPYGVDIINGFGTSGYVAPGVFQVSVSPIAVATPLTGQISTVYVAPAQVPSLQGYSFHLLSSNGKPPHDLGIQTETHLADGSATFTGTWKGGGPNGKVHEVLNGTLKYDANGNLEISFAWISNQGTQNTFLGTITTVHSPYGADNYLFGVHYHLEGDVTAYDPNGGPGHVSGDSALPPPVMKM